MAAIFYNPSTDQDKAIFRNGFHANTSISIPALRNFVGTGGDTIITEVTIQNKDTLQYFLTFDDFISYYYFGKGLGSISISGMMFSDRQGYFKGSYQLNNVISRMRGTAQTISFGNVVFKAVISSFTIRASSEGEMNNVMEFNIQMDVIDHSLVSPRFRPAC